MTNICQQCHFLMMLTLDEQLGPKLEKCLVQLLIRLSTSETLIRLFLNYSDEEMAMLAFYLLFQMEDSELMNYYHKTIDQWWISIKYSENPLWYYIYQLYR